MSFQSSSLFQAVASGDENSVTRLLEGGADVDSRNDGGQTPLILAILSGHLHLLGRLQEAGANPLLSDNTGLNAIEWAQRKGRSDLAQLLASTTSQRKDSVEEPSRPTHNPRQIPEELRRDKPLSAEEKSLRWLAGLKQRLDEKANREGTQSSAVESQTSASHSYRVPDEIPIIPDELPPPPPITAKLDANLADKTTHTPPRVESKTLDDKPTTSSRRKRCPECNTIYNSDLLAYCSYHVVALVDADEPIVDSRTKTNSTPLFWTLVLVTLLAAVLLGLLLSDRLFQNEGVKRQPPSAPQGIRIRKGVPVLSTGLVGTAESLPEAEVPLRAGDESATITVRIRVDKTGRVYSALSSGGDRVLRDAATDAAKRTTFSVEKLGGRSASGTITYSFTQ